MGKCSLLGIIGYFLIFIARNVIRIWSKNELGISTFKYQIIGSGKITDEAKSSNNNNNNNSNNIL